MQLAIVEEKVEHKIMQGQVEAVAEKGRVDNSVLASWSWNNIHSLGWRPQKYAPRREESLPYQIY